MCAHMYLVQRRVCEQMGERKIHPVPFPLSPHYKTVGFSESTDELQREFHLKMELMP